jgi:hypothetical protein
MLPPRMGREWLPPFGAGGALHKLGGEVRGHDEPDGGLEGLSAARAGQGEGLSERSGHGGLRIRF